MYYLVVENEIIQIMLLLFSYLNKSEMINDSKIDNNNHIIGD
jgi:hypothetical protein